MKKLFYILCVLLIVISCSHKRQSQSTAHEDSMVMVYGFGKLPIDSGVEVPYKEFSTYKDSFTLIYDEVTESMVYMRSKCGCKFGDWYVDSEGDTLFCVEDNYAKYVSAEEWHEYYERFKDK